VIEELEPNEVVRGLMSMKIDELVRTEGYAVVNAFGPEDHPYMYTVGLTERGLPELVVNVHVNDWGHVRHFSQLLRSTVRELLTIDGPIRYGQRLTVQLAADDAATVQLRPTDAVDGVDAAVRYNFNRPVDLVEVVELFDDDQAT
jgi:Domain of unknown function (DUF4262)